MQVRSLFVSQLMGWLVFLALGIFYITPLREKLRFGSDLVGGTYLTLEVHTDEALKAELVTKMQGLEKILSSANKALPQSKVVECDHIKLQFKSAQEAEDARIILKREEPVLDGRVDSNELYISFPERLAREIKHDAVQRNIGVLRTRLDRYSVAEIPIASQGEKNIIVELPDVADPRQAKSFIGTAAQLDFRLVEKVGKNTESLMYELDGVLPEDRVILPGKNSSDYVYLVEKYPQVTGKMLRSAQVQFGGATGSEPVVAFVLDEEGGNKFYDITTKNYGKPLAIVLDGSVISAPRINGEIRESGVINGLGGHDEAKELAHLLKSGSFVARVSFQEERQIGPSLGAESRHAGLMSCLMALGLLLLFSLYYYKLAGLFAFLALIVNLILVLMGMAWLGATLTLPGIGGLILTIGMAIDASILIYERIKEELNKGASLRKAVNIGFSEAMVVILDANMTTFIVGLVLYYFGTGPVQGFAVTMMFGIIATLLSGLFFLRALFNWYLDNVSDKKLSI